MPAKPKRDEPLDKESVKMLWLELGASETARRLGLKIGTVTKWASRYKWTNDRVLPPARLGPKPIQVSQLVATPSTALAQSIKEHGQATREALARATMNIAAAVEPERVPICSASHLKDLASAAARVFGWDQGAGSGNTYNTLVVTAEQLDQIRELRAGAIEA